MNRRTFIRQGVWIPAGMVADKVSASIEEGMALVEHLQRPSGLFALFQHPDSRYAPFVRWW